MKDIQNFKAPIFRLTVKRLSKTVERYRTVNDHNDTDVQEMILKQLSS